MSNTVAVPPYQGVWRLLPLVVVDMANVRRFGKDVQPLVGVGAALVGEGRRQSAGRRA